VNFNQTGIYTFVPDLIGALSVNKLASGTTILTGLNTYTGATVVSAGALIVSGSANGTASMSVASGALLSVAQGAMVNNSVSVALSGTLSGAGSVGSVTVTGGVIAPGTPGAPLIINGPITLDSLSSFQFTLGSTVTSYDSISSGAITLAIGATLVLNDPNNVGASFVNGDAVTLFGGAPVFSGIFTTMALPTLSDGLSWSTANLYTEGELQVVPEPGAWAMLAGGFGLLALRQRMHPQVCRLS
jgi:autotransporter-associated beta strand protein